MLIDTARIDHLRVNFVSHFNAQTNIMTVNSEIKDIINKYPKEMTSEISQWLDEQQTNHLTAPLATVDTSKSIDDFDEYLTEIEENLTSYKQDENNEIKLKVFNFRLLFAFFLRVILL